MIEYLERYAIYCDLNFDWVSLLVTLNHMLNYVSTQLVSFFDLTWLIPVLWLYLISFSLTTWLNWVWVIVPYYFKLFWLWCSYLHLPRGRWWKTPPITFRRLLLVRSRSHSKYTSMLYPYILGSFNYYSRGTI